MMESGAERATGTPDTVYNLSSVLFHALEGGASYDRYIRDAEEAGDGELADFFRRVRDEDSLRADEAQLLLAARTPTAGGRSGAAIPAEATFGEPPVTEPPGVAPGSEVRLPPRVGETSAGTGEGSRGVPGDLPGPVIEESPSRAVERETAGFGGPEQGSGPPGREEPAPERRAGEAPRSEDEGVRREEDKGLVDKARDYLRGEDREEG